MMYIIQIKGDFKEMFDNIPNSLLKPMPCGGFGKEFIFCDKAAAEKRYEELLKTMQESSELVIMKAKVTPDMKPIIRADATFHQQEWIRMLEFDTAF